MLDVDLQQLVNGMWTAGAEAISVNGHRLTSLTAIRGAGTSITVDYSSLTPPYTCTRSATGTRCRPGSRRARAAGGCSTWSVTTASGLTVTTEESLLVPGDPTIALRVRRPGGQAP